MSDFVDEIIKKVTIDLAEEMRWLNKRIKHLEKENKKLRKQLTPKYVGRHGDQYTVVGGNTVESDVKVGGNVWDTSHLRPEVEKVDSVTAVGASFDYPPFDPEDPYCDDDPASPYDPLSYDPEDSPDLAMLKDCLKRIQGLGVFEKHMELKFYKERMEREQKK